MQNSHSGAASTETILHFYQSEHIITGTYEGGAIKEGHILAIFRNNLLDMRYHCITTDRELKVGCAIARVSEHAAGQLRLNLNWQWLDGTKEKGTSMYLEVKR